MGLLTGCKAHQPAAGSTDIPAATAAKPTAEPAMPAGRLNEVAYSYQGMQMNTIDQPRLKRTGDGKAMLTFSFYHDECSCEVSDTLLDKARDIIEAEKMYQYDASYSLMADERILDGYSWSFSAVFEGGARLSSHGRNASPKGSGLHRMEQLLLNAAMECLPKE